MRNLVFVVCLLPISSYALCVKYDKANLRSGPGPKYAVTWTVSKYTPLLELKRQGGWIQVQDQDGEIHWVYGSSVTSKMSCVSVKTNVANLRTKGSSSSSLADIQMVDKYTAFERIDIADNGWYQVKSTWGGVYWLHPNLVWRPMRVRGFKF